MRAEVWDVGGECSVTLLLLRLVRFQICKQLMLHINYTYIIEHNSYIYNLHVCLLIYILSIMITVTLQFYLVELCAVFVGIYDGPWCFNRCFQI